MQTWQRLNQTPGLLPRYFVKEYVLQSIRDFFRARNYHELESPILASSLPQERYLDVLTTDITLADGSSKKAYLIPSTETYNKKALVAGIGNHFVITKVFRGLEEISPNHSPEFTMLEWYELGNTYFDLMDSTEELVRKAWKHVQEKQGKEPVTYITYQGRKIELEEKWYRISVRELLKEHLGIELDEIQDLSVFQTKAREAGVNVDGSESWQDLFELVFADKIEPNLPMDRPTFVYDYPSQVCVLTKINDSDPKVCEKVEIYMAGKELGNGYTELLDSEEQKKRFDEEKKARKELGRPDIAYDHELVEALRVGMPPVAGIGLGIDRLVMIMADCVSISDINMFPAIEMFNS